MIVNLENWISTQRETETERVRKREREREREREKEGRGLIFKRINNLSLDGKATLDRGTWPNNGGGLLLTTTEKRLLNPAYGY